MVVAHLVRGGRWGKILTRRISAARVSSRKATKLAQRTSFASHWRAHRVVCHWVRGPIRDANLAQWLFAHRRADWWEEAGACPEECGLYTHRASSSRLGMVTGGGAISSSPPQGLARQRVGRVVCLQGGLGACVHDGRFDLHASDATAIVLVMCALTHRSVLSSRRLVS